MAEGFRRRARRIALLLGSVTDKPHPKLGSREWWLTTAGVAVCTFVVSALFDLLGVRDLLGLG